MGGVCKTGAGMGMLTNRDRRVPPASIVGGWDGVAGGVLKDRGSIFKCNCAAPAQRCD